MKNMKTPQALSALAALAQAHRLAVFRLLVEHAPTGLSAGNIAERLELPPATLSFHLKELSHSGLIDGRQDGRFIWYSANIGMMNGLIAYLTRNCCAGSAVCDPACVPVTSSLPQVLVQVAQVERPPRKRRVS
jgi:DNA-binding transcriptional ArsR family regulator